MIEVACLDRVWLLPIEESEPITLNTARQVSAFLQGTDVRSVLILTSGFKSKRISFIFSTILEQAGIATYCLPVWGAYGPENWTISWHGIQEVFLQRVKLGYYGLCVL